MGWFDIPYPRNDRCVRPQSRCGCGKLREAPNIALPGACGPGPTLFPQVLDLVNGCFVVETTFIVTFAQGCAERLYAEPPYSADWNAACVARALSAARFACAEQVPCWLFTVSTLP